MTDYKCKAFGNYINIKEVISEWAINVLGNASCKRQHCAVGNYFSKCNDSNKTNVDWTLQIIIIIIKVNF